jgi:hypothetical protein
MNVRTRRRTSSTSGESVKSTGIVVPSLWRRARPQADRRDGAMIVDAEGKSVTLGQRPTEV